MENPYAAPPTQSLDAASARPSRARYILLIWLCSAALIAYIQRNSLGVAESTMRAEFQVDKTTMGWAINAFALAYAGLVGTALAWSLWFGRVAAGEAGRAASYIFFVPLVGVLVGAVLLDETLTASLLVGGALVVLGVYLVNRRARSG